MITNKTLVSADLIGGKEGFFDTQQILGDPQTFMAIRAGDGIRTHDVQLGKLAFYH